MTRKVAAAVALGSNLGDREAHLRRALERIAAVPGVELRARSRFRETAPEGGPPQGPYLNGVALLETSLSARELLVGLLAIEQEGGRVRREKNGPRTIDLDLLFHGEEGGAVIDEPGLELPHPRLDRRRFVLEPLAEVAPHWRHPKLGRTARELLDALDADRGAAAKERAAR